MVSMEPPKEGISVPLQNNHVDVGKRTLLKGILAGGLILASDPVLRKKIINWRDIEKWAQMDPFSPPSQFIAPKKMPEGPIQNTFGIQARNIIDTLLKKEKGRIPYISIRDQDVNSGSAITLGTVFWGTKLDYGIATTQQPNYSHLIHELFHGATPRIQLVPTLPLRADLSIDPNSSYVFQAPLFQEIIDYHTGWYQAVVNNYAFFHNRFTGVNNTYGINLFDAYVDKQEPGYLQNIIEEMLAELSMDYVDIRTPPATIMPSAWPSEVESMMSKSWNYIQNGTQSHLQPLTPDQTNILKNDIVMLNTNLILEELKIDPISNKLHQ